MSRLTKFGLHAGGWLCIAAATFASGCAQERAVPATAASDTTLSAPVMAPVAEPPAESADEFHAINDPFPPPPSTDDLPAGPLPLLDKSCAVDADCEVKDVGNCCGRMPACVSRGATVDPSAVQRECQRTGASSICGFQELSGCQCVDAQCTGIPAGGDVR